MSFLSLEGSVGLCGRNNPIDVAVIQRLLISYFKQSNKVKDRPAAKISPFFRTDGECTQELFDLVKKFQAEAIGMKYPDGRVDPLGKTFKQMTSQMKPILTSVKEFLFGPDPGNTGVLTKVNPEKLRKFFIKQTGLGLTTTNGEDLLGFFNFLQNDPDIQDIRWAAYILATVHHETTFSFKVNKIEDGKGGNKKYAENIQVVDHLGCRGPKNVVYANGYYGRGYVQLTHRDNYLAIGRAFGIGDELYINPDKAFEPEIAYFATSYGMRNGTFTQGFHKLSDYIIGKKCNYKEARQIINGKDRWMEIAKKAKKIEILLRLCAVSPADSYAILFL